MVSKNERKKIGKHNRTSGQRFELRVRKDLEGKGWIVDRWSNNVELKYKKVSLEPDIIGTKILGKLIPAKSFMGRSRTNGFPDFVIFKPEEVLTVEDKTFGEDQLCYQVIGVECKSNGYLNKIEKEKIDWLLNNNIFSKILIAKKGKGREIVYNEK